MLKLLAMLSSGKVFLIIVLLFSSFFRPAAAGTEVFLLSPVEGEYLQGVVTISGGMDVQGFLSYETAFAYEDGREKPTWFLIKRDINQVQKGTLAVWDTSAITDGEYKLRVLVELEDGKQVEKIVNHLHVSNYSPIPGGEAQAPTVQASSKVGGAAPAEAPVPVVLPVNPAELTRQEVSASFSRGFIGVLVLFAGVGFYLTVRYRLRKK
ncbi:MAG: hypothetical protein AB9891_15640 [Anaerolineaceae bacterium]